MGVVALPSRVTGLAAISMRGEMTFIPECQGELEFLRVRLGAGRGLAFDLGHGTVLELAISLKTYPNHVGPDVPIWAGEQSSPVRVPHPPSPLPSFARPGRWDTRPYVDSAYFTAWYLLGRGGITKHLPLQTQTWVRRHREQKSPSSSSASSGIVWGNPACSARRDRRAWPRLGRYPRQLSML